MLGFAETAEKVFEYGPNWSKKYSRAARQGVDYALMATYYSTGCVYIVFIANTFHNICNDLLGWDFSVRIYILFVIIPCLFIGQIRNLKHLVPFSGSANVFILVTFGIVLYYIFKEPLDISDKPAIVSWTKWPVFFRYEKLLTFYCFTVHLIPQFSTLVRLFLLWKVLVL